MESSCRSSSDQNSVINSARLLTRIIPHVFEDPDWTNMFWSSAQPGKQQCPAQSLLLSVSDLLFCPGNMIHPCDPSNICWTPLYHREVDKSTYFPCLDFTVTSCRNRSRDEVEELVNIDSCEYIWEKGVGCALSMTQVNNNC